MNLLYLDFESYYSTETKYTLNKKSGGISMLEYIRSPKFKAFGVGVADDTNREPRWYSANEVQVYFDSLNWSDITVVAHNAKFDGAILKWIYGKNPKTYICTLSMARAVLGYRVVGHSLATVAEYYGFAPKGKMQTDGLRDLSPEQEAALASYCLHDVELCRSIYLKLAERFPHAQYEVLDWTLRCFIDPMLTLHSPTLKECNVNEKLRREKIFEAIGIDRKVFSSNDQFCELLEKRGFEVPYKKSPKQKNEDGSAKLIPALALGDTAFQEMINSTNEELADLCEARVAAKSNLLETRSEKFLRLCEYGTFPFDIGFSGAKQTHRFSGEGGAGGNPQNLTRGSALRRSIKAPEGYTLLVADFAAIEARIVAWLAREGKLVEDFTNEKDPYCSFATRIYQREITKVDKRERQFGKTCVLGLGYNMGAKKFKYKVRIDTGMDISDDESRRVVGLYRMFYGRIPALWQTLQHFIPYIAQGSTIKIPGIPFLEIKDGCVYLPSGLALQYPELHWSMNDEQWVYTGYDKGHQIRKNLYGGKLLENISQGLAGEVCKVAITRARKAGLVCVGQVHDEIIALVPHSQVAAGKATLKESMEAPIPWWPTLKLKAEVGAGPNWLEAKV